MSTGSRPLNYEWYYKQFLLYLPFVLICLGKILLKGKPNEDYVCILQLSFIYSKLQTVLRLLFFCFLKMNLLLSVTFKT